MNQRQRESVVQYCYDISKAVHVGWMIGYATGKTSWISVLILVCVGIDFFIFAYRQEEDLNE